jgi:hypothetical protein
MRKVPTYPFSFQQPSRRQSTSSNGHANTNLPHGWQGQANDAHGATWGVVVAVHAAVRDAVQTQGIEELGSGARTQECLEAVWGPRTHRLPAKLH